MLVVLRHIELVKLGLTHSFETWHMKLDLALADSLLMQSVQIIHEQIWAGLMRHVLQKKVQQLQCGLQLENLTQLDQLMRKKLLVYFGKIIR
jgi:hypothetical protein